MQLKHLEKILTVGQCGSISKAAEQMGVSQSSLSKTISELEDELGVVVFMRSANGVLLTEAGQEVIRLAKSIDAQMDNIRVLAGEKDHLHGSIRVALLPAVYNAFGAELLKEFKEMYPLAELQLVEKGTNEALMAVAKGECRLAMGLFLPEEEERYMTLLADLNVAYTLMGQTRFKIFVSTKNPLAEKKHIYLADLEGQAVFEYLNNNLDLLTERGADKMPIKRYKVYNRETMKKLISLDYGLAILPDFMEREDYYIQSGLIKGRYIEDYAYQLGCYLFFPQKSVTSPLGNSFIILLSRHMENLSMSI